MLWVFTPVFWDNWTLSQALKHEKQKDESEEKLVSDSLSVAFYAPEASWTFNQLSVYVMHVVTFTCGTAAPTNCYTNTTTFVRLKVKMSV